jgi:hypothetical protein
MRIRSWLVVAVALVAAMAGNWAAAGSASAVTRTGVFTRKAGHAWTLVGLGGVPAGCGVRIPLPVRRAWHVPNCATATSPRPPISHQRAAAGTVGDLVDIALDQVGVHLGRGKRGEHHLQQHSPGWRRRVVLSGGHRSRPALPSPPTTWGS